MNILIVDDSSHIQAQLSIFLNAGGYSDLYKATSQQEAFVALGIDSTVKNPQNIDLILMDIEMEQGNGIEATSHINSIPELQDIPIIMVTADTSSKSLQAAFDAGAVDYITKPIRKIELLARVRSFLHLKNESDIRKTRETELMTLTKILEKTNNELQKANGQLQKIAHLDGLTGIDNRRFFDKQLQKEWELAEHHDKPLSLIMIDIDCFKAYNDTYGHQMGDECLKKVASQLSSSLKDTGEMIARYGGEEFAALLPESETNRAVIIAKHMLEAIEGLKIPHTGSTVTDHITISIGISCTVKGCHTTSDKLLNNADAALYQAKKEGRNRMVIFTEHETICHLSGQADSP